jgi:hypothetical protein
MKFNLLKHLSQEEKLNTISHAIGILVGLIALPILLLKNKKIWLLFTRRSDKI